MEQEQKRHLSVTFSKSAYDMLASLAQRKGMSMADVLRQAIELEKRVTDANSEGSRILIERNGNAKELLIG